MRVSKNRWRGAVITDINELVALAKDKQSVIVRRCGFYFVRPASFIIGWPLRLILNCIIYHALSYDPKTIEKEHISSSSKK